MINRYRNMIDTDYLGNCKKLCQRELDGNIMPFWKANGVDLKHGGIYTSVDRQGALMDTTKSVWFQGRWGYIASEYYVRTGKTEYLELAKQTIDFIEKHCFDVDGHMFFAVTEDGRPLQKRRYVFSECFAIMAFAEFSLATGDCSYADKALDLYKKMLWMLEEPAFLTPKYNFSARGHSITMMLINVGKILEQVVDDPLILERELLCAEELRRYFMHPEFASLLETVGPNGEFIDTGIGRTINPGHCLETGWFILDLAQRTGRADLTGMGLQIIDWAWEWGWDKQYGGIINFKDCKGFPHQDYSQDMKFWWPQCEAILASLYAYLATKDGKYLDMHRMVREYAFSVFPDKEFGEWYGYLHRDGSVAQSAKGNLFKGPFHIPRMMMMANDLYEKILTLNNK